MQKFFDSITMSSEELLFKFNSEPEIKRSEGFIGKEEVLEGCIYDFCVKRHLWNTLDMYHSYGMYSFCHVYSGRFNMYTSDIHPTMLECGDMCIIPPEITYKFSIDYKEFRKDTITENMLVTIMISENAVTRILSKLLAAKNEVSKYLNSTLHTKKYKSYMILRSPGDMNKIIAELAFREIESSNSGLSSPVVAELMINALILDYIRNEDSVFEYSGIMSRNTDLLPNIMNYIHANFSHVTLDDICREFSYTPSYICTLIKKYTGTTLTEYITNERLDFVCKQLVLTDKKIKEIIEESGYVSIEHFYRVFKKKFSISPQKYRDNFAEHRSAQNENK